MNHPIKMRSPMYCIGEKLCNKCAGERYYKLGISSIGLGTNKMGGNMGNASLKLRHQLRIFVDHIDEKTVLK